MKITRHKKILIGGVFFILATAFAAYYFLPRNDIEDKRIEYMMRIFQLPIEDIEDMNADEFMQIMHEHLQRMRSHLLYETDHIDLLHACRELSKMKAAGMLKRQTYKIKFDPHPETAKFPKAILELEPSYIFIDYDGRIMLEMAGGLDHFGINAYPEGYKKPSHTKNLGDKKLIDGLWYYDGGYRVRPEDYEKRIEALRPKAGDN